MAEWLDQFFTPPLSSDSYRCFLANLVGLGTQFDFGPFQCPNFLVPLWPFDIYKAHLQARCPKTIEGFPNPVSGAALAFDIDKRLLPSQKRKDSSSLRTCYLIDHGNLPVAVIGNTQSACYSQVYLDGFGPVLACLTDKVSGLYGGHTTLGRLADTKTDDRVFETRQLDAGVQAQKLEGAESSSKPTKSGEDAGKKEGSLGKKGGDMAKKGGDVGKKGGDMVKKGGDMVNKGEDLGKKGGDMVEKGGDVVKRGGDVVKKGGDVGKKGGDVDKKGGDVSKKGRSPPPKEASSKRDGDGIKKGEDGARGEKKIDDGDRRPVSYIANSEKELTEEQQKVIQRDFGGKGMSSQMEFEFVKMLKSPGRLVTDPVRYVQIDTAIKKLGITKQRISVFRRALVNLEEEVLDRETVKTLMVCCPNEGEVLASTIFATTKSEENSKLDLVDELILAIHPIPNSLKRLEAKLLCLNFDNDIEFVSLPFETILMSCRNILESEGLAKFLTLLLGIGNDLFDTKFPGFKFECLDIFEALHTNNLWSQKSLLDCTIDACMEMSEDFFDFVLELERDTDNLLSFDFDGSYERIHSLLSNFAVLCRLVEEIRTHTPNDHRCLKALMKCIECRAAKAHKAHTFEIKTNELLLNLKYHYFQSHENNVIERLNDFLHQITTRVIINKTQKQKKKSTTKKSQGPKET